jgi:alpha-methylacyl-CoA racemase
MSGPLSGLRVTELAGLGAAPFAGLLLADLGAEVVRVDRLLPGESAIPYEPRLDLLNRGRRSIAIDLKHPKGTELVLRLVGASDVLLEGFRPGVTERLGLGPDECMSANPRLVYGRVTGWGRDGPYADRAGHDLNYIALSGTLEPIGTAGGPPVAPLNHLGDFAGGGIRVLTLGLGAGRRCGDARRGGAAEHHALRLARERHVAGAAGDEHHRLGGAFHERLRVL